MNVKYVYFMIYCNAQLIHFGEKGTPGYTAYILLHRSLAVLSIILIFYKQNKGWHCKWYKCLASFKPFFKSL